MGTIVWKDGGKASAYPLSHSRLLVRTMAEALRDGDAPDAGGMLDGLFVASCLLAGYGAAEAMLNEALAKAREGS